MFEIANGTVVLSPENQQYKYGLTPPEVLIIHELHKVYANGSPLLPDFEIQDGCAFTVESDGRQAVEAQLDHLNQIVPAKPAIPAKIHDRTNIEECDRLKRKYTGNIIRNGSAMTAFSATFGTSPAVKLPETFAEIEPLVGIKFGKKTDKKESIEQTSRKSDLMGKIRSELCDIAIALGLKIHPSDTKEVIANAIIEIENKPKEEIKE